MCRIPPPPPLLSIFFFFRVGAASRHFVTTNQNIRRRPCIHFKTHVYTTGLIYTCEGKLFGQIHLLQFQSFHKSLPNKVIYHRVLHSVQRSRLYEFYHNVSFFEGEHYGNHYKALMTQNKICIFGCHA